MDQPTRRLDPSDDAEDDAPDSGATQHLGPPPQPAHHPVRRPPRQHADPACPKCQGAMQFVEIHTSGGIQLKRPDVLLGWMGGTSGLSACVCTLCGFVEFYATDLNYLLRE